ncbi:aminotransferase class V-fold PLP-dependent enzyme [Pseudomaricurvus sp. HS19]|uniref:aminotransferase class V-fold PLP-dependent enzyme n=1 Tax=Pseudomaricurvus sp. HS19 TaxID=2692626 RepID=UPI00136B0BF1|nr:aminotransferase class V-fold PLP-dependent enzyme [Pseudomaricurvus sp. HS19]MYM64554.1 aminotransferase class V-fold PLP-dependent enzyme [Pseudomaricurvus sp. HS19]
MSFDNAAFKQQFPLFQHPENAALVYLDNAATTQRPQCVIDAMVDFYSRFNANTHRSSHRLARQATAMVERVRGQAAAFVNAAGSDEIIFTRGATEALNLLAAGLCANLQPGDEILLSAAEHHANLVPWQMAAERYQLKLRFVPLANGAPAWERLPECVSERTRIVSLTAASNALGFATPLAGLRAAVGNDVVLIVDASQRLAHETLDVQALGIDFLLGSAHKFYGPTGIGLLYGRRRQLQSLPPWQGGGEMITRVTLESSDYAEAPHRFEAGTSSLAAIAGLGACLEFLQGQDRAAMQRYESHLCRYLHTELQQLCLQRPLRLLTAFRYNEGRYSEGRDNVGIAALAPMPGCGVAMADLGHWLDEHDIAVRVGHHCAEPLSVELGVGATLRVSLAGYNNRADVDALVAALASYPWDEVSATAADVEREDAVWPAEDFSSLSLSDLRDQGSWQKRYRQLTRWAGLLQPKPALRLDANRVPGCESPVWIVHRCVEGRHQYLIDTDSRVLQGLAVLLLLLLNDRTGAELATVDVEAQFAELGLEKYLSESRNNGFRALVDFMRARAS